MCWNVEAMREVLEASRVEERFWTGALLISQQPWAAGLNAPGASPVKHNLLDNKKYE